MPAAHQEGLPFLRLASANNIAVGYQAGFNLTTGNNNIYVGNVGVVGGLGQDPHRESPSATFICAFTARPGRAEWE